MICKNVLPATAQRVAAYTNPDVNEMIRGSTLENLKCLENAEEAELSRRIQSLNAEWDMERFVEAKAAACVIGCSLLGMSKRKFWSFLTLIAGTFLLQHALLGWCPTAPVMRKMGIRTAEEISQEKTVLKLLRGDFSHIKANDADGLLKAAEKQ
ncbi:MAG TPA: DUF2892 domain-containing protein [Anaerovoracaceae bacterium]|nr:DUF2892 domain-containing protein [Anaerovoracaceae bacterium]